MNMARDLPCDVSGVDARPHVPASLSASPSLVALSFACPNVRTCIPDYEALGAATSGINAWSKLLR